MKAFKTRNLYIGLSLLLFSGVLSYLVGMFLDEHYPNPVEPEDVILDNIKEQHFFVIVYEIFIPIQLGLLIFGLYKDRFVRAGEVMGRYGLFYILRSISMLVTPLGQLQDPLVNGSNPFLAPIFYKGMFFSGHTGLAFLVFFFDNGKNKVLKILKLFIAVAIGISLILSHSHYSIDIIGGFLAAYFVSHVSLRKLGL